MPKCSYTTPPKNGEKIKPCAIHSNDQARPPRLVRAARTATEAPPVKPGRAKPAPNPCNACDASSIPKFGAKICIVTRQRRDRRAPRPSTRAGRYCRRGSTTSCVNNSASAFAMKPYGDEFVRRRAGNAEPVHREQAKHLHRHARDDRQRKAVYQIA